MDPVKFRLLTIANYIDRRWAAIRLEDIQEWTSRWALPEMIGAKGGFAPDAAFFMTSLDIEGAKMA
eukprot:7132634-Alexandrium_andersonii.AAC.1